MANFLTIDDFSREEVETLLDLAAELKREYIAGSNRPLLHGKTLAMIFQKPSLRTRVSFEMAVRRRKLRWANANRFRTLRAYSPGMWTA